MARLSIVLYRVCMHTCMRTCISMCGFLHRHGGSGRESWSQKKTRAREGEREGEGEGEGETKNESEAVCRRARDLSQIHQTESMYGLRYICCMNKAPWLQT